MLTLDEARALVPPPTGAVRVTHQNGLTRQIIGEVLAVAAESAGQGAALAARLRGATALESCANAHAFVRQRIRYELDPSGQQLIKTPAAVVGTGFSDCKGYAILLTDILRALGIRCAFRFVSFAPGSRNVSHVYAVAWPHGAAAAPVVLDACLPGFGQEKPYTYKEDHMTQISRVSGLGLANGPDTDLHISGHETDLEMSLKLMRQGAALERDQAARVQGIGSAAVGEHQAAVRDYTEALGALAQGEAAVAGFLERLRQRQRARLNAELLRRELRAGADWRRGGLLRGVGELPAVPALDREERRIGWFRKAFSKARSGVRFAVKTAGRAYATAGRGIAKGARATGRLALKGGKLALRVATAPARLLAKGLLEVFLPRLAPMFLYLFVTNQGTIASLPPAAARKRRKALAFAKFITGTVGMKEAHFLKAVRNGIQKRMGGSPEQVLAQVVRGPIAGVGDIGLLPLVALAPLAAKSMPFIQQLLEKIMAVFGQKPAPGDVPTADDAPDPANDFAAAAPRARRKLLAHVARKPASQRGEEPDTYANEAAQEAAENATHDAIDAEADDTPADAPLPDPAPAPPRRCAPAPAPRPAAGRYAAELAAAAAADSDASLGGLRMAHVI